MYSFMYETSPKKFTEAVSIENAKNWTSAMNEEMEALMENDTFELVELPSGKSTIGGRWVYALKDGPQGNDIYKARYVAKGFSQTYGVCLLYTSPSPRDLSTSRMPSSA